MSDELRWIKSTTSPDICCRTTLWNQNVNSLSLTYCTLECCWHRDATATINTIMSRLRWLNVWHIITDRLCETPLKSWVYTQLSDWNDSTGCMEIWVTFISALNGVSLTPSSDHCKLQWSALFKTCRYLEHNGLDVYRKYFLKRLEGLRSRIAVSRTPSHSYLPYGITQCYLPPDTSDHIPP